MRRIEALAEAAEILAGSQPAWRQLSLLLEHGRERLGLAELGVLVRDRELGSRLTRVARAGRSVLMDCRMPVMDGYEATRRLRLEAQGADVPIIALTASALKEDVESCFAAGMSDYLTKPFELSDLAAVLDRWLL